MDWFIQAVLLVMALGSSWVSGMLVVLWDKEKSPKDRRSLWQTANVFGAVALILGAFAVLI